MTSFFRDPEAFDALASILDGILAAKHAGESVRVWAAGCSTGEEAYSLAIMLKECQQRLGSHLDVQIFATDLDDRAIDLARRAVYPDGIAVDVSPERLEHLAGGGQSRPRRLLRRTFVGHEELSLNVVMSLADARATVAEGRPDLIIADLKLPDGDGVHLITNGGPPVVVLTTYDDAHKARATLKAGALDYLVKSPHVLSAMPEIAVRLLRQWEGIQAYERAEREKGQLRDEFLRAMIRGRDEERSRIARELHDELGQGLAALGVGLEHLKGATSLADVQAGATALQTIVEDVSRETGRLARGLDPRLLDELGLRDALVRHAEQQAAAGGFEAHVEFVGLEDEAGLPSDVVATIYRIGQEALTNITRHAAASSVDVLVRRGPDGLRLVVEDDGSGFDPLQLSHGLGLRGIRERAAECGGWADVASDAQHGTVLTVHLPLSREHQP